MRPWAFAALGLLLASLSACTLMPSRLEPGADRAEIERRLGAPTAVIPWGDGTRLQYSGQPMGREVYNLDLDAQGRLLRVEQVLETAWLLRHAEIDRWTREMALRSLGRPAQIERVARFEGDVWTYRLMEAGTPRQAHLHFDPIGVLRQLVFSDELMGDDPPEFMTP